MCRSMQGDRKGESGRLQFQRRRDALHVRGWKVEVRIRASTIDSGGDGSTVAWDFQGPPAKSPSGASLAALIGH